jgi:hypothetical protein
VLTYPELPRPLTVLRRFALEIAPGRFSEMAVESVDIALYISVDIEDRARSVL